MARGTWHFARRVPAEFAHLDRRGVVRHSTKIRIASDRAAVRASRVAEKFNSSLEQHWRALADSDSRDGVDKFLLENGLRPTEDHKAYMMTWMQVILSEDGAPAFVVAAAFSVQDLRV
jgi:hypothetical protein